MNQLPAWHLKTQCQYANSTILEKLAKKLMLEFSLPRVIE